MLTVILDPLLDHLTQFIILAYAGEEYNRSFSPNLHRHWVYASHACPCRTNTKWKFLAELLFWVLVPLPGQSKELIAAAIWLGFARNIFLCFRMMVHFSPVYTGRGEIIRVWKMEHPSLPAPRISSLLVLKTFFLRRPLQLTGLFTALVGIFGIAVIYVSERDWWWPILQGTQTYVTGEEYALLLPEEQALYRPTPFVEIGNCIWFTCATFTTAGYGDIVPITAKGRTTATLISAAGLSSPKISHCLISIIICTY